MYGGYKVPRVGSYLPSLFEIFFHLVLFEFMLIHKRKHVDPISKVFPERKLEYTLLLEVLSSRF